MTTAVDTNILLDVLSADSERYDEARDSLLNAARAGRVIVSEVVYAELASNFPDETVLEAFLDAISANLEPSSGAALHRAGLAWAEYSRRREPGKCPQCGAPLPQRQRVVADFMIGAHALVHAGRLITRDRGYYGTYFPDLTLV